MSIIANRTALWTKHIKPCSGNAAARFDVWHYGTVICSSQGANRLCSLRHLVLAVIALLCAINANAQFATTDSVARLDPYEQNRLLLQQVAQIDWGQTLTSLSMRFTLRVLTVDIMKRKITEMRPDGSADNSMPSRHAVWAYGIAGSLTYATGKLTPWVGVVSQTAANAIGMQRVTSRRHWPGDVAAGAGLGLGIDILSRGITNLIFDGKNIYSDWHKCHNTSTRAFLATTSLCIPLRRHIEGYRLGTAFASALRCDLPVIHSFGVSVDAEMMSMPITSDGVALHPVNSLSIQAGPSLHLPISNGPFAIRANATCGYSKYLRNNDVDLGSGTFRWRATTGVDVALTQRLQIGAEAGYGASAIKVNSTKLSVPAFSVNIISRASF